jgi:hypothetical protein
VELPLKKAGFGKRVRASHRHAPSPSTVMQPVFKAFEPGVEALIPACEELRKAGVQLGSGGRFAQIRYTNSPGFLMNLSITASAVR